ncbi:MAG: type II toxin-antitoxin system YafQ family toxin [Kiritimatiellia bacterium]
MPYTLVWTPSFKRTARKFLSKHRELVDTFSLVLHKLEANPNDPELRLHPLTGKLSGKHAVRLTFSYRIVLRLMLTETEIILLDVGSHDEVYG